MSSAPPIGEHEERRLLGEMSAWEDSRLIAVTLKQPGLAAGIAAQQILDARKRALEIDRQFELLQELRRPQWKTPNFWLAAIAAITGCISVYPILWPGPPKQSLPTEPVTPASAPYPLRNQASASPANPLPPASTSPASK